MPEGRVDRTLRLAELIGALSLATDLGLGLPQEHVLRQCRIALGLAERLGLDEHERAAAYYVALLAWVGCTAGSDFFSPDPCSTFLVVCPGGSLCRRKAYNPPAAATTARV